MESDVEEDVTDVVVVVVVELELGVGELVGKQSTIAVA